MSASHKCRHCWRAIRASGGGWWQHLHSRSAMCIPGFSKNKAKPQ